MKEQIKNEAASVTLSACNRSQHLLVAAGQTLPLCNPANLFHRRWRQISCAEVDAYAIEETRLRAECSRHRQAAILWRRTKTSWVIKMARLRSQEEQPGREFSLASSTTRATTATVQIARISAKISVHSRRRLQHLQHPTPFDFPKDTTPILQRSDERMANRDARSVSTMATPNARD